MHYFANKKDFEQAAIDWVARLVSEKASETIATGNVADIGQQTLTYLESVALTNGLTSSTINVYTDIISEHNQELLNIFDQ
ncbi:hypothetical protein ACT3TH_10365 [Psychrobacter sp. AOP22-C1-C5]|uniref:hypothetical protein n=1 Tax=Psychrobacter sp. AOP22-C1-C5 TaxID=3457716 RepID=UPI004036C6D3